jgi:hypothetical protein
VIAVPVAGGAPSVSSSPLLRDARSRRPPRHFRTAGSDDARGESRGLAFWGGLARGGSVAHRVAGSHGTILQQLYVRELARAILAAGDER